MSNGGAAISAAAPAGRAGRRQRRLSPLRAAGLLLAFWLAGCSAPAARVHTGEGGGEAGAIPTAVLSDGSAASRGLEARLWLDPSIRRASSWSEARLIWVLGASPPGEAWAEALQRVREGRAGLVVVGGDAAPDLRPLGLELAGERSEKVSLRVLSGRGPSELAREVVWPSAPQAGRRWLLHRDPGSSLGVVVSAQQSEESVVLFGRHGAGRVAVVTLALGDPSNREVTLWPYFNYLLHVLSCGSAGVTPSRFADWPPAPVPGKRALIWLLLGLAAAWALTLSLFAAARRYSKRRPELIAHFFKGAEARENRKNLAARGEQARRGAGGEVSAPGGAAPAEPRPGARSGTTASANSGAGASGETWSSIGFVRPLAGFLTLAGVLFLLFAPFFYVTNVIIPNHVQPFPQAKGAWDFAWEALQIAWFLFDAGTFVAFVKYFAEFRLKDPSEAVRSAQFFVWWQVLTGLVQVTAAILVAIFVLPHTRYGYTSNLVILIALGQYPGCFAVVTFFFQAYQRFDYNIALDLLSDWVLRFALQIPAVLFFRAWGAANPEYGEALGAAIGIGVGHYASTVVSFVVGVVLYRRLGLRLLPLFLAHFDRRTAARMLRYGVKVVAGQAFFRAAKTVDRVVISLLLINYTEWLGIEAQIHFNLMFLFPVAYRFFETAMAALSESHGNGKPTLTQYYLVRFLQIGALYTAIGLSLMWALGPLFVQRAMDPQWARAADYLVIAALIGAFYAPAWLSDMLQKGAGRPGLFAVMLGTEQTLRIVLFFLFIPRWQFHGFYLAILFTIALKVIVGWSLNHALIVRLRLFGWQMFVAPALAGLVNYGLLRLIGQALPATGRLEVIIVFFCAALASFFVCFFVLGLAGGFDRALTEELERASRMTGPLRPLTRLFYLAARSGWSLSPLHGRFPVTIHESAMAEARELELRRAEVDRA